MKTNHALQSTNSAAVASPDDVLEPALRMIGRGRAAQRTLRIVVYTEHNQANAALRVVSEAVRELGVEKAVSIRARAWRFWWFLPALKGAWQAPVIEMNGAIFSKGRVPDKAELKKHIHSLLI